MLHADPTLEEENRRLRAELAAARHEHRQTQALQEIQNQVLERIARAEPLADVLEALVQLAEAQTGMLGSVLLVQDGKLRHGAAPNLPAAYNQAIDGIAIGPGVGSCGTAAHTGERVIVEDVATHPYWAAFKDLALGFGLAACWSQPVRSATGEVVGTFALYYQEPRTPDEFHLKLVEQASHLAGIALEFNAANERLVQQTMEIQGHQATMQGVLDSAINGILVGEAVRDAGGRIWDFRFTLANPMCEKITGVPRHELVGYRLLERFPANVEVGLFDLYVRVTETGVPEELETYYGDGRLNYWVNVSAVKVGDGVAITFSDVTERRKMAEDLQAQRRFAETLIDRLPAGVAFLDRELRFQVLNPTLASHFGLPREDALYRSLPEVLPGAAQDVEPLFRQVRETLEPVTVSAMPLKFPGGQTWWDATIVPYPDQHEAFAGWLVVAQEVSERHQLQAERDALVAERIASLEQANVHKEQFLSILSHELRTPINAIMGFASILDDEVMGELTDDQHGFLAKILDGSERLLALINDLLDMSRIQAGMFLVTPGKMELTGLCRDTMAALQPLADRRGIEVTLEAPEMAALVADRQRIEQVLINLVSNGIKFTAPGGRVRVCVLDRGTEYKVEVHDTGIGIADDHQKRIFDAFTQVDMSNTRVSGGAGLGLAISKSLVEAHHGRIGVRSVLGQGSCFWFSLPKP